MPRILDRGRLRAALVVVQKEARFYPSLSAARALQKLIDQPEVLDRLCREVNLSYEQGRESPNGD